MKEKDIDEILQHYNYFTEIVRQLSLRAEEQAEKLKGTAIADEIATDFSEIGMQYAKELLHNEWINEMQFQLAKDIDAKFGEMTKDKNLWTDEALFSSAKWEECRNMGKELLNTLEGLS